MGDIMILKFSVQGSFFAFPARNVLSHEWLVKTIVETNLPKDKFGDAYYIDCDCDSFRFIYQLLNSQATFEDVLKMSPLSIAILRTTARYLLCFEIEALLDSVQNDQENCLRQIQDLSDELANQKLRSVQREEELKREMESRLERIRGRVHVYFSDEEICDNYRTHRPRNQCGNEFNAYVYKFKSSRCEECSSGPKQDLDFFLS